MVNICRWLSYNTRAFIIEFVAIQVPPWSIVFEITNYQKKTCINIIMSNFIMNIVSADCIALLGAVIYVAAFIYKDLFQSKYGLVIIRPVKRKKKL